MLHKQSITPEDYREAMSRFAGHVHVVTAELDGIRRGMTATACCSVSDAPPTVLVCINRTNPRNETFFNAGSFAINTLAIDHVPVANAFSGFADMTDEERFSVGAWDTITTGAPTLADARAVFDCRVLELKPMSTHMVVFGQVVGLRLGEHRPALIYLDRNYRDL
ncbi:flavin reductase [Rhizobium sp. EC-SD404]|uniref:flavin reductase n=1 Tax=Rhizobium sp. EC-SD404 TaxID=2038389 RepID=UPI00125140BD|nr:flavin reductase [Rhizobium sp. EC-SD404]VVT22512.1 FMN reductase (NADH) RutF [Rhizobium sp. EC-SD404]